MWFKPGGVGDRRIHIHRHGNHLHTIRGNAAGFAHASWLVEYLVTVPEVYQRCRSLRYIYDDESVQRGLAGTGRNVRRYMIAQSLKRFAVRGAYYSALLKQFCLKRRGFDIQQYRWAMAWKTVDWFRHDVPVELSMLSVMKAISPTKSKEKYILHCYSYCTCLYRWSNAIRVINSRNISGLIMAAQAYPMHLVGLVVLLNCCGVVRPYARYYCQNIAQ